MKNSLLYFFLLLSTSCFAQTDTIRIAHYNLLNYGPGARTTAYKNERLKIILDELKPDVLGVNEIKNDSNLTLLIRDSVLGSDWEAGQFFNTNNDFHHNCLFWNKTRLGLKRQFSISHVLRDIIAYELYYKHDPSLTSDTVFFTVIVAHLKSSTGTANAAMRAAETQTVKDYLNNVGRGGNYLFMGDMNVYNSTEACYQNLVANPNPQGRLYDPINRPGRWSGVDSFAAIHTQATRTSSMSDSGATGGLDDRFDQILVSGFIMGDSSGMMYLPGSYKAFGQDGLHYDLAINAAPTNAVVSQAIANALHQMSDHLPVTAQFVIARTPAPVKVATMASALKGISANNPIDDKIVLQVPSSLIGECLHLRLFTAMGALVLDEKRVISAAKEAIKLDHVAVGGLLLLSINDQKGGQTVLKLVR